MTKLLISTQVFENYAWGEDGTLGTGADAYWKAKGGNDYVVKNVDECDMVDIIVDRVRGQIECDNEAYREYIVSYKVVADDHLTWFEESQMRWDGKITCPVQEITL